MPEPYPARMSGYIDERMARYLAERDTARTERDEARAALARRDITIAAVRAMSEELAEAAPSLTGTAQAAQQQIALALRDVLSAPVEAPAGES